MKALAQVARRYCDAKGCVVSESLRDVYLDWIHNYDGTEACSVCDRLLPKDS